MKIASSLLFVSVAGLLVVLLLFQGREQAPVAVANLQAPPRATTNLEVVADDGVPAPMNRFSARPSAAPLSSAALLAAVDAAVSAEAESSLQAEVDGRFANYLSTLDRSPQQLAEIRGSLIAAYGDILAFGDALERGDITAVEADAMADPNYVVNQLASVLDAAELTALETYLEEDARRRFRSTYAPQLQVVGAELSGESSERLLETLFTETHLALNPDGIGAASNLELRFQRQLDALANTRDRLRLTMTPEQFLQADKFLGEQERGLLGAQTIFSSN